MLAFRFANGLFEPIWNRNFIDYVQITSSEDIGIGSRAGYYDTSGALRDLVQNHMLQLLTLLCMEPPVSFSADEVRDEKVKVLHAIHPPKPEEVADMAVRAQYAAGVAAGEEVRGYLGEDDVPEDSSHGNLCRPAPRSGQLALGRCADLPAHRQAAGAEGHRDRRSSSSRCPTSPSSRTELVGVQPNQIVLTVQPNEGASISLGAKIPGTRMRIRPVNMEFLYGTAFMSESPEAYERLIMDAMRGDATLFTRDDEVEAQWTIVDPIIEAWAGEKGPIPQYEAGTQGPEEAERLLRPGHRWRAI